jgi:hypothetical protein
MLNVAYKNTFIVRQSFAAETGRCYEIIFIARSFLYTLSFIMLHK